jgi:hypothetical protein
MNWGCRPKDLALRHWADGTVVFDEADGHLHLLAPIPGQLLQTLLACGVADSADLAKQLLDEIPNDEDIQMVENVLGDFSDLHLVHRLID